MALTGDPITGEGTERHGMVSVSAEAGVALIAAQGIAWRIARNGPARRRDHETRDGRGGRRHGGHSRFRRETGSSLEGSMMTTPRQLIEYR